MSGWFESFHCGTNGSLLNVRCLSTTEFAFPLVTFVITWKDLAEAYHYFPMAWYTFMLASILHHVQMLLPKWCQRTILPSLACQMTFGARQPRMAFRLYQMGWIAVGLLLSCVAVISCTGAINSLINSRYCMISGSHSENNRSMMTMLSIGEEQMGKISHAVKTQKRVKTRKQHARSTTASWLEWMMLPRSSAQKFVEDRILGRGD